MICYKFTKNRFNISMPNHMVRSIEKDGKLFSSAFDSNTVLKV